ncbi:DUF3768 domain-containing protein [Pseudaminobacter sp. 19-2017]|uniref:DUF3768 domain-containing protein n=2 Tax=Pseudaminobacter soli (ex Zhang et al. 2022) TaxID=2831468 RepID=A0A942EC10_9HYPH|nr:DUF3768 domain-containing protein [Pseudaminobacter soli]
MAGDELRCKIRDLNDQLRIHHRGGVVVITPGIAALGPSTLSRIATAVATFTAFNADNDPYGEHDCAVMTVENVRIIWKIDYYDLQRQFHSPDPSNPEVTRRVLIIMRADE